MYICIVITDKNKFIMKKIALLTFMTMLFFTTSGQNETRKTAESYNKRGTYLMNKQMYAEAIKAIYLCC